MRFAVRQNNLLAASVAKEACVNIRRDSGRKLFVFLSLSSIALAAMGCSGQTPTPRDARAAGEWTFRLPETRSPYAGLAIAHGTGDPAALAMVDDALAETAKPAAPVQQKPQAKRAVLAKVEQAPAAEPVALPIADVAAVPVAPQQLALNAPAPTTGEEQRYSQREQQSQKQRDFRGGDAIVISASALVIILLVVILVLLLT